MPGFFQDETITILEAEKKNRIRGSRCNNRIQGNDKCLYESWNFSSLYQSLSPGLGSFLHFLNPNKSCTTHKSLLWLIKGGIKWLPCTWADNNTQEWWFNITKCNLYICLFLDFIWRIFVTAAAVRMTLFGTLLHTALQYSKEGFFLNWDETAAKKDVFYLFAFDPEIMQWHDDVCLIRTFF